MDKKIIKNVVIGTYNTIINGKYMILGTKEDLEKKIKDKVFFSEFEQQKSKTINLENVIAKIENIKIIEEPQDDNNILYPKLKLVGDVTLLNKNYNDIIDEVPTFALRGYSKFNINEENIIEIITFDVVRDPNWKKGEIIN